MTEVATLSSTGEIKLPLKLRTKMGLNAGDKFDVEARGMELVFVKRESLPSADQVSDFVAWTKKHPREPRLVVGGTKKTTTSRPKTPGRKR